MGIMVSKDLEQTSELNRRITSDLRARTQSMGDDSDYGDNYDEGDTKKTGRFAWVWLVLIILAVLSLIWILFI